MINLNITREKMIVDINNHLTGLAENITCSGAYSMEPGNYRFLTGYKGLDGIPVNISIKHTDILEGYHNYNTSILPKFLKEKLKDDAALIRLWSHIKDIN
jgi:hypothetical protein